jgi:hypothetical protein
VSNYNLKIFGQFSGTLPWSTGIFASSDESEASVAATFHDAVSALWTTATNGIQNFLNAEVTVTSVSASTLNSTFHQVTTTDLALAVPGTDATASMPWSSSIVVKSIDGFSNKGGHGRLKLPSPAVGTLTAGLLTESVQDSIATVFGTFAGTLVTAGIQPFLWNRLEWKDGTAPFTTRPLVSPYYLVSNKLGTVRRRVSKQTATYLSG